MHAFAKSLGLLVCLAVMLPACGSDDESSGSGGSSGSGATGGAAGSSGSGGATGGAAGQAGGGGTAGAAGGGGVAGSGGAAGMAGSGGQANVEVVDCASATTTTNVSIEGTIGNFQFNPADVTVSTGDVVKWKNNAAVPHTTTSGDPTNGPDGNWNSGSLIVGQEYCVKFLVAQKFDYYCTIHTTMTGSVTVQ